MILSKFELEIAAYNSYTDLIAAARSSRAAFEAARLVMPARLSRFFVDNDSTTSADTSQPVRIESAPNSASNAAEGLGPNNASQAKGAVDAK